MESRLAPCDSRHAHPALLRLTLRCLTCHGGVGVLLGCFFFFLFFLLFFLFYCSLRSIKSILFFFWLVFFPPHFCLQVIEMLSLIGQVSVHKGHKGLAPAFSPHFPVVVVLLSLRLRFGYLLFVCPLTCIIALLFACAFCSLSFFSFEVPLISLWLWDRLHPPSFDGQFQ